MPCVWLLYARLVFNTARIACGIGFQNAVMMLFMMPHLIRGIKCSGLPISVKEPGQELNFIVSDVLNSQGTLNYYTKLL